MGRLDVFAPENSIQFASTLTSKILSHSHGEPLFLMEENMYLVRVEMCGWQDPS